MPGRKKALYSAPVKDFRNHKRSKMGAGIIQALVRSVSFPSAPRAPNPIAMIAPAARIGITGIRNRE